MPQLERGGIVVAATIIMRLDEGMIVCKDVHTAMEVLRRDGDIVVLEPVVEEHTDGAWRIRKRLIVGGGGGGGSGDGEEEERKDKDLEEGRAWRRRHVFVCLFVYVFGFVGGSD